MKKRVIILSLILTSFLFSLHAQDYSYLKFLVLKEKSDYQINENLIIELSKYILNSPIDILSNDINHADAVSFLMRWMTGTPDYNFVIDPSITNATKSNPYLLGVFSAAVVKFVLENKDSVKNYKEIKYNSYLTFINFCEDETKHVKKNKEIKNLIKAKNNNTLKEYLKI
jgi:hypothetical protein